MRSSEEEATEPAKAQGTCEHRLALDAATRAAIRRLSDVGSPAGLLARAGGELGAAAQLDRVLVSEVRDGALVPRMLWERDSDDAEPPPLRVPLVYPLVEADIASRDEASVVDVEASAGRAPAALAQAFGWRTYVVVALRLGGSAIGMLHADATASGRALGPVDGELVALFARGLTAAYEVAVLRAALERHREAQRTAVRELGGRLERADAETRAGRTAVVDRLSDPLTAREQEVLELLARGLTNRAIAQQLVISEGTVKYHVKNVLRKLRATSRADAVARHLQAQT